MGRSVMLKPPPPSGHHRARSKRETLLGGQHMPSDQFEQVLRPLFRQDERTLIIVGAALGSIAGCIQWLLVRSL